MTLRLDRVTLRAGPRAILREVSLQVAAGQAMTLMGPSGVGKSSLLAYACGTLPRGMTGEGAVWLDGVAVTRLPPHRRRIGILFQDDLLFPHMSVGGNLLFGLAPDIRGPARHAAVAAALQEAELPGIEQRDPATLSGGQRARVALMRVLLSQPRALLLDEPFSSLDAALRERFRTLVLAAAQARSLPLLLVTHDPSDAMGQVLRLS